MDWSPSRCSNSRDTVAKDTLVTTDFIGRVPHGKHPLHFASNAAQDSAYLVGIAFARVLD
jgi:hypothetical protein